MADITRAVYYTVPKVIDIPRYIYCNMKCSGENVILRGIFHVVSGFHVISLNLDCFSNSVPPVQYMYIQSYIHTGGRPAHM